MKKKRGLSGHKNELVEAFRRIKKMSASTFNTGQLVELSDDSTALKDGTRGTVMGSKKNGKVVVSFPGPVRNLMTSKNRPPHCSSCLS